MTSVFTIGIDRRFADELAKGVLAQHGGDPLALADVLILLPTRRSVRALREAFLRAAGGKPTILPRMAPLGDVDESEWEVASGDSSALALPPAIEPAERELLAVIAGLPQGRIVLPGLDRDMDDRSWMELDETHPQFGLRELLKALGHERRDVADWPGGTGSARHLLITELMRPAETTEEWIRPLASSLEHVTRADCATPHQEALVIA